MVGKEKRQRILQVLAAMPTYIAMLRGINVGGHGKVPMEKLRSICEKLNYSEVRTFIQSGNVVFEAAKSKPENLSQKIRGAILAEFGFEPAVITRTPEELAMAIANNPFVKQSKVEPAKVHIAFLSDLPKPEAVKKLEGLATPDERVQPRGREIYLYYRNGMGQAKLTGAVIERVLGIAATARNWNTVTKLYEMAGQKS
jgi:uncharacterized protein (DUF1697 family)